MEPYDPTVIASRFIPDEVRALTASELSRHHSALSQSGGKTAPRFSVARAIAEAGTERGLSDGFEREICGLMSTTASEHFDRNRILVPLWAFATRDLNVASAPSGGYLVSTVAASPFDVLRPFSVAIEAGITIVQNLTSNVTLPRVTTPSAAGWVSTESSTMPTGQPVLGQAAMAPKTASVTVNLSRQFSLQAEAGGTLLNQQLLGAVGKLWDEAIFAGTGASGQPTGILNTPGIGTQSGTSLAHAGILAMRQAVLAAGGREDRLRWVGTPTVQQTLGARERAAGGGRFLWDDGAILGRPAHATSTAPAGMLCVGDFSQAVLGVWGPPAVRLEVNPYQDFKAGIMAVRVVLSVDLAIPNAAAFTVAASVT